MNFLLNIESNDQEVLIRRVHVPTNTQVKYGDLIIEIESSKTIIDVYAEYDGLLLHSLEMGRKIKNGDSAFEIITNISNGYSDNDKFNLLKNTRSISSKTISLSTRKQSEINNLLSLNHSASTSVISILLELPGKRIITPPFLFKNGLSDILVYEAAKLLDKYRELNSYFKDNGLYEEYEEINFGWAFDSGNNLKVLNINSANKISLPELQNIVFDLLKAYEANEKIPLNLITGSTVTFTDLSHTEVESIIPLINGRQSLILGLTKINKHIYKITAAYDHRISSGLTVAKFLSELKSRIFSYYSDKIGIANLFCYACHKSMADELSLGHRGFIRITKADGNQADLCRNCFDGW